MRFNVLPDSLFGRLYVTIIAVFAAVLITIVALVVRERRELLDTAAGAAVTSIAEAAEQLATLPPEQRTQALDDFRAQTRSGHALRRARVEDRRVSREQIERTVIAKLQRRLGDRYHVRRSPPGPSRHALLVLGNEPDLSPSSNDEPPAPPPHGAPGPPPHREPGPPPPGEPGVPRQGPGPFDRRPFEVEVELPDGDRIDFRMPAPRPAPPLPQGLFFNFVVLALVLGAVLFGMTRTITRPLGELARAADAIGRGERVEPLPEKGGRELRAATRAFNSMQERLHRYLDSRTRVLAAMSHDLRTPLTRLRLRVEAIDDEQLRNRCSADLDEMNNMIRGALGLFRGLNDEEPAVAIDVNALLEEVRDQQVELGGVVTLTGQAREPFVGKLLALKRCIGNLVQNAIQYGDGQAEICVDDGAALVIRVRDRGPGIPSEALEQVFEPFFRLEASRSRDTGGTGLGLSIARDIAQAHDGSLQLQNLDRGLEARLTLPRGPAAPR